MRRISNIIAIGVVAGLTSWAAAANAAIVQNITASGPGLGTYVTNEIDVDEQTINATKTFANFAPITLEFTVGHGGSAVWDFTETIVNNSGVDWLDFHFTIVGRQGVNFPEFTHATLDGFNLVGAPMSGPRHLDFVGFLGAGESTVANFGISMPAPGGSGSTYTFDLVQLPTADGVPVPEPGSLTLLGAGLLGLGLLVRRRNRDGHQDA